MWKMIAIILSAILIGSVAVFAFAPVKGEYESIELTYELGPSEQMENGLRVTLINTSEYYGYYIIKFVVNRVPQYDVAYLNPNQTATKLFVWDGRPYEVEVTPEVKLMVTDKVSLLEYLLN